MARLEAAVPAARSPATPGRGTGAAAGILRLQRTAGNAAVKRILARDPLPAGERWFRGQASDVSRTKPGQVVHDLVDGVYYTSSASAAQGYGDLRAKANPASKSSTGGFTIDRALLGRVLDLPKDPRWAKFLDSPTPHPSMGTSWRAYMSKTTEFFNSGFRTFLDQNRIKFTTIGTHVSALPDFDAVIAEDLIRNPKTQQLVITNPAVVARVDAATKVVHVVEANAPPTPIGTGRGAGGGRLPDAPQLQVDRSGRVKLFRTIGNAELQALVKHGDFDFAPSGGGKYFSFSAEDALALAAKSPGGAAAYTLIETTVPRSFLPETTDTVHKVNQPHLPARPGPASMIQGDVIIQVDRQGAGWALHVDDEALTAMNKLITRPEIVQSPGTLKVPVGGSSGGTPAKPPDKAAPKDPPSPPVQTKDSPKPPGKSSGNAGGTVAERGGVPIEVPAPGQRVHEKQGVHSPAERGKAPPMRMQPGPPSIRMGSIARGGMMALASIIMAKLVGDVQQSYLEKQIAALQPEIHRRALVAAQPGIALLNELGPSFNPWISITIEVEVDSSIDPDLHQRIYGLPFVGVRRVFLSYINLDGQEDHWEDVRAFAKFDHYTYTYSVTLHDVLGYMPASPSN